jgi:hypothetical protein
MVGVSVVWGRCKTTEARFFSYDSMRPTRHRALENNIYHTRALVLFKHSGKRMSVRLFGNIGRAPQP